MTFPAVRTEEPVMRIKMTHRAEQLVIQNPVIHVRNLGSQHMVFLVTHQAVLLSLMKTDFLSYNFSGLEAMTSETLLGRHPIPWLVADGAIRDIFMKDAERSRLSRGIVKEKPSGKGEYQTVAEYLIPLSHRNHLNP
jgi:hypothetical protein